MWIGFPLFPEQASTLAAEVDALYFFLVAVSAFFTIGIAGALLVFAVRYRRRSEDERPAEIHGSLALEIAWSVFPLLLTVIMFGWGASLFFRMSRPPDRALEINVVGKRWMWKLQHMTGQREINELHVPVGRPVRLKLASEDVIHSFFVPAFRIKQDAVPGRYLSAWFQATKTGTYQLFCAEYCGTEHSRMIGRIVVMEPADYQAWLSGAPATAPMEALGEKLFRERNCATCHLPGRGERGPSLHGLFGQPVALQGGGTVTADEAYIRESILNPQAKLVVGFTATMPTYQGLLGEEEILQIIAYLRTLKTPGATAPSASGT